MSAEATFPMFFVIALAVGAGLLAVFVLWLSKFIANDKTRAQGIAVAAITVGVLLLGLFVTRSSVTVEQREATLVAPMASSGAFESSVSIESGGRVHVHAQHPQPSAGAARLAWGPLTIGAIAVAVILLLVTSRRGLAAALAGLGIVGAILLMILFAARHDRPMAQVAEVRMASPPTFVHDSPVPMPSRSPTPTSTPEATHATDKATDSSTADVAVEAEATPREPFDKPQTERRIAAESSSTTETDAAKNPPPAWIDDEPTMDAGVYRAVVISGPYSTTRECETHLDEPLRKAMIEYGEAHHAPSVRDYAWLDLGYVRNNMIEERYLAEERYSNVVGKMYSLHARLKVEPRDVARFNAIAQQSRARRAVEAASLGGIFVFGALVVLYGGLRFVGRKKPASPVDPGSAPADATV